MITEADARAAALALPETTERPSYGTPAWRVRDKWFARIREEGDVLVLWCADESEKEALIAAEPEKFFTTPHYNGHRLVIVRFGAIEADELSELLAESWRLTSAAGHAAHRRCRTAGVAHVDDVATTAVGHRRAHRVRAVPQGRPRIEDGKRPALSAVAQMDDTTGTTRRCRCGEVRTTSGGQRTSTP